MTIEADILRAVKRMSAGAYSPNTIILPADQWTVLGREFAGHCGQCGYKKRRAHICPRGNYQARLRADTRVHVAQLPHEEAA